ncbi:MAG: Fic family protein [Candidatus Diapherotrites archaeon]
MVYVREKEVNGKKYRYLTKSIRLPDGTVKKIQKRVAGKGKPKGGFSEWFGEQEKKAFGDWAAANYRGGSVFSEEQVRKAEEARVDYKKILRKLSKPQLNDLFDRFTVNFTYESNAIEGNSLTLKDVVIVLFEKTAIKGKELREIYETRNSRDVVDLILRKKFKVCEKDIIKMHKLLVRDMRIAAGYKTVPNFVLGRTVRTTQPEKVGVEMQKLLAFYNENCGKLHPLELAAKFHGEFERIHPFEDGNGRVGRFLINVILVNNGYPPLIIRKTQRLAYFKCLTDFDNGYKENLERFLLEKFKKTYSNFFEIYVKYL